MVGLLPNSIAGTDPALTSRFQAQTVSGLHRFTNVSAPPSPRRADCRGHGSNQSAIPSLGRAAVTASMLLATLFSSHAQPFSFPTANHALFEPGGEERFFVGTPGRSWVSGAFGCVRSEGWQVHEGLDIRCLERDEHGEATDPILATADGTVAYVNDKTALSNYGRYIVIQHSIQGIEIYSLYAHLSRIGEGLGAGQTVAAGEQIGIMGRTANTRTPISRERAHVHFELNLLLNDDFPAWFKKTFPKQRNDHGLWNGRNLVGLDPRQILLTQYALRDRFDLVHVIRSQPELMRVAVRETDFPWLHRYPQLVLRNPKAEEDGVAGYEIAFNYNGLPFQLIPRSDAELPSDQRITLLAVQESEYKLRPGRKLVIQRAGNWALTTSGTRLMELLLY